MKKILINKGDNFMNFENFLNLPMSNEKAYVLGLLLPKIVIAKEDSDNLYLIGQISHGHQVKPSDDELLEHHISLKKFLTSKSLNIPIIFNTKLASYSTKTKTFRKITNIGFALCLELNETENNSIENLYTEIREKLIEEGDKITEKEAPYFIAGTIDGRSSIDTTMRWVSLDIDSDDDLNDCLISITKKYENMDINLNLRDGRSDSSRMNQLRYKEETIKKFYSSYSSLIFSKFRLKKIEDHIIN